MNENERCLLVGAVLAVIAISTILDLPPYTWISRALDAVESTLGTGWGWPLKGPVPRWRAMRRAWERVGEGISKRELSSEQGE